MSKAKYEQGKRILSMEELANSKSVWFRFAGKSAHVSALWSLQYRTLEKFINSGLIYEERLKKG